MNEAITPEHVCLYLIVRRQAEVSYFFIFLLKECTRHVMNVRNIPEHSIKKSHMLQWLCCSKKNTFLHTYYIVLIGNKRSGYLIVDCKDLPSVL